MGKFRLNFSLSFIMLYALLLLPLVAAVPPHPLGQGTGNDKYMPTDPSYNVNEEVYKAADKDDCHPVEEIVYDEKCIPYMEKTCYTQQREQCKEVYEKNCTAVIDEFEERECFDVTELMCSLAESIQYEMVDETYTVQRCTGVTVRVCDTVYDLAQSTEDDFQCVDLEYQYCWDEDKIVKDRTCVFSVDFDCKKKKPYDGQGAVQCEKTPTKKCYDTPRKVQEEICKPQTSKYCEKFTNDFPYPVEKQNCHTEPMKKCELESRTRPKKAKKYLYNKECKPVPGRCARTARARSCAPCATRSRRTSAATSRWSSARRKRRSTASRWRRRSGRKCAPPRRNLSSTTRSAMFNS